MRVRVAIAAAMAIFLAARAEAQPVAQPRVIQLMPVELKKGKVVAVQPRMIVATSVTGERWALQIGNESVVRVRGTADLDLLQPRQLVRVRATVDKRRSRVTEKVKEITLTTPAKDPERMPGVFYPGQEEGGDFTPPAQGPPPPKAAIPAEPLAPPKPIRPAAKPKGRELGPEDKAAENEELLDVRGYILKINKRKNELTLEVPNAPFRSPLTLEIDPEAVVSLDLLDYSLAKAGDEVSAHGYRTGPQLMEVRELDVTLSAPLSTKKRTPAKPLAKQQPARPKPGEQEPFEVAENGGKPKPADPPAKPQPPGPEPRAVEGRPPAAGGDPAEKILPALSLPPGDPKGGAALSVVLGGGDPLLLIPAKEQPADAIRRQFGDPGEVQNLQGSLPVGEGGARKDVRWQVWTYGGLRIFVDEAGKTRYFHLGKK